jgi:hypothetical protein
MVAPPLFVGPPGHRRDNQSVRRHADEFPRGAGAIQATRISLPIHSGEIHDIASSGFLLWEPLDALQLRNYRISLAYWDLSCRLSELLAGTDDPVRWNANWCTFATWASKTVGSAIDRHPDADLLHHLLRALPPPLSQASIFVTERMLSDHHGAIYRALAIGNRLAFLEIATAVARFLDTFGPSRPSARVPSFDHYWRDIEKSLLDLKRLDPSWMESRAPDPQTLRAGLLAYKRALDRRGSDPDYCSQEIMLGNLLIVAYEQHRLQPYVLAALSPDAAHLLHRILRHPRKNPAHVGMLRAPISTAYAALVTRCSMALELPRGSSSTQYVMVGQGIPYLDKRSKTLYARRLEQLTLPELQAVWTRFDRSKRSRKGTRAEDWTRYHERMNFIANLFRSRQNDRHLFQAPWPAATQRRLLAGRLPQA